jgi:hypothetical protein
MLLTLAAAGPAQAQYPPDLPAGFSYSVRFRVQEKPAGSKDHSISFYFMGSSTLVLNVSDGSWTAWTDVPSKAIDDFLDNGGAGRGYAAMPFVLEPEPARGGTLEVDVETRVGGKITAGQVSLLSGVLYLIGSVDGGAAAVRTATELNRKYWPKFDGLTGEPRAKKFVLKDYFWTDFDRVGWEEGIRHMAKLGINTLALPIDGPPGLRDILLREGKGINHIAHAIYMPPGYVDDVNSSGYDPPPDTSDSGLAAWAQVYAKQVKDSGFALTDLALFHMSDEPGYYLPVQAGNTATVLARFHQFLQAQGLTPGDFGHASWSTVKLVYRGAVVGPHGSTDIQKRRLFYWTTRFFPWVSSTYFARATKKLEEAFYPGLPVTVNFNDSSSYYWPGNPGGNPETGPDSSNASYDWLEFGRVRGATTHWSEFWFNEATAYSTVPYYGAMLRSGTRKSGIGFGVYIIGSPNFTKDGVMRKALAMIGYGAKTLAYYNFGPEPMFPGNSYSDKGPYVLQGIATANRIIATAEDVLYPGAPPPAQVAILMPQSSQPWHRIHEDIISPPSGGLYFHELEDLYLVLSHSNIPADYIEELELTDGTLAKYKVLYIIGPNVPKECQQAVATWVQKGGVLVTGIGAANRDRYDDPAPILNGVAGVQAPAFDADVRGLVDIWKQVGPVPGGQVSGPTGNFTVRMAKEDVTLNGASAVATFADGKPAVTQRTVGAGQAIHFSFAPGFAYSGARFEFFEYPIPPLSKILSEEARKMVIWPTKLAGVAPLVSVSAPYVEAPVLTSSAGTAVTLINWNSTPAGNVTVNVRASGTVKSVASALKGPLVFRNTGNSIQFSLHLDSVDVVTIKGSRP